MTKETLTVIGVEELADIARGAAILGCGGGGDPEIGRLMADEAIRRHGPVTLLPADDVADGAFVLASAMMGAPTVVIEKIPSGLEPLQAFRRIEQVLNRKADAVCSMECGGLNSTIPILVAAQAGLPLLDGDGMGRAFPELQMETFSVYGVHGTPACVVDEDGTTVVCEAGSDMLMEWILRGVTIRMGGASYLAHYPMSGADFKRTAIHGTMSLAYRIGRAVREAREHQRNPITAVMEAFQGTVYGTARKLFEGKLIDVQRETRRGFALGQVTVAGTDAFVQSHLTVSFQNENLIAWRDGTAVAAVPDLIMFLDPETGQAIPTERLHYGQRAVVLLVEAPDIMTTPEALAVWGPEAFGYPDLSYWPIRRGRGGHSGERVVESDG
jgi:DUF917 family protein